MSLILKFTNLSDEFLNKLRPWSGKDCNIFISGGSVLGLFEEQAIKEIDTSCWCIYFVDERLTNSKKDLNHVLAYERFLKYYCGEWTKLERDTVEHYEFVCERKRLNMALIGMGEDGHIASLFPDMGKEESGTDFYDVGQTVNETNLREFRIQDAQIGYQVNSSTLNHNDHGIRHDGGKKAILLNPYIVELHGSPKPPPNRLSLTPLALSRINMIFIFVCPGKQRKERLLPHEGILKSVQTQITIYHPEEKWPKEEQMKYLQELQSIHGENIQFW